MEGPFESYLHFPWFLALATSLFRDQVVFRNRDRLTGAILKSHAKNFVIRTVVAGEVTVCWQEIQELRSDQKLYVELMDGRTLVGRVTNRQGMPEIETEAGKVEATKQSVAALLNDRLAFGKSEQD